MKGVKIQRDDTQRVCLCIITEFSSELKVLLSQKLASICEGSYHSDRYKEFLSYENTLKTFLERFNGKKPDTQMGMIGELLCHLIFPIQYSNLRSMSPFFNLEENSIKKGHDLVYFDQSSLEIWPIEVKSGKKGTDSTPKQKKAELLNRANQDMQKKLSETSTNLWRNALKGMDDSVGDEITKSKLEKLLAEYQKKTLAGTQSVGDYNVVLVSFLFHDVKESATIQDVLDWKSRFDKNNPYKKCIVFSIQKSTFLKIVEFLKLETAKNKGKAS